ncbi:hypothetical protein, partial [Cesiribacter andamanensis]|uniref:hypothetical protein n=1 Tax=Cesiribacter andamanensis TaxID=649507 RepID=UPI001F2939BE
VQTPTTGYVTKNCPSQFAEGNCGTPPAHYETPPGPLRNAARSNIHCPTSIVYRPSSKFKAA